MNISYTSAVSDRCAQQNSAVLVLLVPFVTLIVGTIRVLEQITLGDKNAMLPTHSQSSPILEVDCSEHSHGVSFLEGAGGFQALLAVSIYPRRQRTDLVPYVFPALNLHRGANPIGKAGKQGKQQF